MPRVKGGPKTGQRHKKVLKMAKGYRGGRSRLYRTAVDAVHRALAYAYRDRRARKRVSPPRSWEEHACPNYGGGEGMGKGRTDSQI